MTGDDTGMGHKPPNPRWLALTRGTIEARAHNYAPPRTEPVTHEQAVRLFADEIHRSVANGARIEYAGDLSAVVDYSRPPNHVLHLLLTLLTFGLWLIVWLIAASTGSGQRVSLGIDGCGNITRQTLR